MNRKEFKKHAYSDKESFICNHFYIYNNYEHIKTLFSSYNDLLNSQKSDLHCAIQHTKFTNSVSNQNIFLTKKAWYIKQDKAIWINEMISVKEENTKNDVKERLYFH